MIQIEKGKPISIETLQISVVIPTYNRGHLVERAVKSALQQTMCAAEIIVVDDGSTDDTEARMRAFGEQVRYVRQENAGSAVARHHGMTIARFPWVALLDSDDIWMEIHLKRMADAIVATSGQGRFYFADTLREEADGEVQFWESRSFAIDGAYELALDASEWVMMRCQPMLLQAAVFNRDAYFECGGFLPALRYRDDTHLFLNLGLDGAACAVAGCGTQMTNDDDPKNRLTRSYNNNQDRGSRMQVIMFRDLLQRKRLIDPVHRRELKRRLAGAYLSLSRYAWRQRSLLLMVWFIFRSLFVTPYEVFQTVKRLFR